MINYKLKRKTFYYPFALFLLFTIFTGCNNKKNQVSSFEKELAQQTAYENRIKQILTDNVCRNIIQFVVNKETKSQLDLSEGVLKLSKEPYKSHTSFTGNGFFEGVIKGKKDYYSYQISLSNYDNNDLKNPSKWKLNKLVIKTLESNEKVFFAGHGVWEVGDYLYIDGRKITLTSNNGIAQKFTTQSKLSKEQIMKLWDCRERPYAKTINLYLPNQKSDYASYNDDVKGLFLFNSNQMFEVKELEGNKYEFTIIK